MKNKKIFVTKSFLPSKNKYISYIDKIWENHQLTNSGPITIELERKIQKYLIWFLAQYQYSFVLRLQPIF